MAILIQKGDLSALDFDNDNSLNSGGVTIRDGAGSTLSAAIITAINAIPDASDTIRGLVELAVAANYPQPTNDVDAVTPAYLTAALSALVAGLPSDVFTAALQSYDPATNIQTWVRNDGTTFTVDMTSLLADAVASIPNATDTTRGLVELAVSANYPQAANNTDTTTPAYVNTAILDYQPRYGTAQAAIAVNTYSIDSTNPVGPVAGSEFGMSINLGTLKPTNIELNYTGGFRRQTVVSGGEMDVKEFWSVDGGATWTQFGAGGVFAVSSEVPEFQENELIRSDVTGLVSGVVNIRVRTELLSNNLLPGVIMQVNKQSVQARYLKVQF